MRDVNILNLTLENNQRVAKMFLISPNKKRCREKSLEDLLPRTEHAEIFGFIHAVLIIVSHFKKEILYARRPSFFRSPHPIGGGRYQNKKASN
jgi:hypothetical protein